MEPRPSPPTIAQAQSDIDRAKKQLAKLGVVWEEPPEEKVYRALVELTVELGRPVKRADLVPRVKAETGKQVSEWLGRLRARGRVIHIASESLWVPVVDDGSDEP